MGFRARRRRSRIRHFLHPARRPAPARSQAGTADIGIIPAAAYTQIPGLAGPCRAWPSPRAAPVRSILLVSKVPVEKIRTVALDTSSMTSVALTKILFEKWLGGGRTFTADGPGYRRRCWPTHDAGLVIGDPALQIDRSRYLTLDLAEEWIRHTGKPFVFAFWAVRAEAARAEPRRRPGSRGNLSALPRPRPQARQLEPDRPRMGAAHRHRRERSSNAILTAEHPLRPRLRLPRRLAAVLSLRGRDRSAPRRAGTAFRWLHPSAARSP